MIIDSKNKNRRGSKEKILEAALLEFSRYGLDGARVDRIATSSGVNKAMIYYHFNSKENLYQEVINGLLTNIAQRMDKFIAELPEPEQLFAQLTHYYYSDRKQTKLIRPIFLREIADGGKRLESAFKKIIIGMGLNQKIMSYIETHKASGKFRNIDSRHAMISFAGMNLYYLIVAPIFNSVWEIEDEDYFMEERQKEVIDLFLHGILAK